MSRVQRGLNWKILWATQSMITKQELELAVEKLLVAYKGTDQLDLNLLSCKIQLLIHKYGQEYPNSPILMNSMLLIARSEGDLIKVYTATLAILATGIELGLEIEQSKKFEILMNP